MAPTYATGEACTWCGTSVEPDDGYRAYEPAGQRRAVFCRLEHIVPWELKGGRWEATPPDAGAETETEAEKPRLCSHCAAPLKEGSVLLVRHRGEHRIADGFCSANHMATWAKAGGRWQ